MPVKEKPRFFYGYVVASAVFLIMMLSWGTLYSFGVFFKPLLNEFGWTRSTISTAFSLSILLYGALTIVAGRLNDKYGPRVVITICGLFFSFGYLVMSQTTAVWQLYLYYCLIGIGMSGFFVPLVSTIARWFNRKRGMMTGIGMSGVGIGTIIIPLIMASFINSYGWRTSYVIVGFITLLSIAGIAQFLRREPSITKSIPQDGELIGTDIIGVMADGLSFRRAIQARPFWLICIMLFSFGFALQVIMVHIVPHAIDLGIPETTATSILATIGGIGIAGRVVMGSVSDRIGNKSALNICFALLSVALFWLLFNNELWMLYVFAVIFGFAYGGFAPLTSLTVAELFGLRAHGTILGGTEIFYTIGAAIGPVFAGTIFDATGNYQYAFLTSGLLCVTALIWVSLLKPVTSGNSST